MQMKAAMIVMAIMGCDDSATKCTQLSVSEPKWPTVAACDKDSEKELTRYSNAHYPMIIAICQSPEVTKVEAKQDNGAAHGAPATDQGQGQPQPQGQSAVPAQQDQPQQNPAQQSQQQQGPATFFPPAPDPPGSDTAKAEENQTLIDKTFGLIKKAIPTTEGIKSAVEKPVHVIANGYSWVVRKVKPD